MKLLCLNCREIIESDLPAPEILACPVCQNVDQSLIIADDKVTVTLPVGEIRILAYWSFHWAKNILVVPNIVRGILKEIGDQVPKLKEEMYQL